MVHSRGVLGSDRRGTVFAVVSAGKNGNIVEGKSSTGYNICIFGYVTTKPHIPITY
jgi:hypothetical protein